jgi:hypothetical protein
MRKTTFTDLKHFCLFLTLLFAQSCGVSGGIYQINSLSDSSNNSKKTYPAGTLLQVDVHSNGTLANGPVLSSSAEHFGLSEDGRFAVYSSSATNLVDGDTNGVSDVFLHDLNTRSTVRVSVATDGTQGNGASSLASISSDGKFIVYVSTATNLVADDTNTFSDVFRYNVETKQTELISRSAAGVIGNGASIYVHVNSDGSKVTFSSNSTNLVSGVSYGTAQNVFYKNMTTNQVVLVSERRVAGARIGSAAASSFSMYSWMSKDGNNIGFYSPSTNLLDTDTNGNKRDAYFFDLLTDGLSILSRSAAGVQADLDAWFIKPSGHGGFLTFHTNSTNLIAGDTNAVSDIYRKSTTGSEILRVSVSSAGAEANAGSSEATASDDGDIVAFNSAATNLVSGDSNAKTDIFARKVSSSETIRVSINANGTELNGNSNAAGISGDASRVIFMSDSSNVPGGNVTPSEYHAYVKILDK